MKQNRDIKKSNPNESIDDAKAEKARLDKIKAEKERLKKETNKAKSVTIGNTSYE